MGVLIGFLSSRAGKIGIAILLGASLIFGAIQLGKSQERANARVETLEAYVKTKKEIEDVEVSPTRNAAIERLRSNRWTR